jgi:putative tricarboxylic transport membrane protein
MYVGNLLLLVLNVPLIGVFVSVLRLPQALLIALVILLCLVGTYSVNNSLLDLWVLVLMGLLGFVLRARGFDLAIVILAMVLGPMIERSLLQTIYLASGDWTAIVRRPLMLALVAVGGLLVLAPELPRLARRWRRAAAGP